MDGTLIEAWASQKSFRPKDGSGDDDDGANFRGQRRRNDTHASASAPNSRLYRKAAGREAKLCYIGAMPPCSYGAKGVGESATFGVSPAHSKRDP